MMKKKIIYLVLIIAILLVSLMFFIGREDSMLQNDKQNDKITENISDKDSLSEETEENTGTNEVEGLEIPLQSGVEDDQSTTETPSEGDSGDVELPAVPIQ